MCLGAARRRADGCLQIVADAERRSLVGEGALPCAAVGPVRRGLDAMGLDGWERGFAYMRICDGGRVRGSVAGLRFVAPKNAAIWRFACYRRFGARARKVAYDVMPWAAVAK